MISIYIEKITIIKDGNTWHDMSTGKTGKTDRWDRRTIYSQIFDDGDEPDIKEVIQTANREVQK